MTAADTYIPDFDVLLAGQPLPAELRANVISVRLEESIEGAGRVELELANPGLRLLDRAGLDVHIPLELSLGYRSTGLPRLFAGEITGIEPTFPTGGIPTLTLTAHDATQRLNQGSKQRAFPWYLTDSVIAAIVAAENGLLTEPDPAAAVVGALGLFDEKPRYQHRQSDYEFLRGIAAEYGFDMWVEGSFLNFRLLLRQLPPPEVALRWGESMLDFTPRLSEVGQLAAVRVQIWVESLKSSVTAEIGWDGERLTTRVTPEAYAEQTESAATLTIPDVPADDPVEAVRWAIGELRRRINSRVIASGSSVGDPRLRVGRVIAVDGVGKRFSAESYRITSAAHTLDEGGYRTRFQVRLEVV